MIEFDSNEEKYLYWYLLELQDKGYIEEIKRGKTYLLSNKIVNEYVKETQLKTKLKTEIKNFNILEEHVYTPDYEVTWSKKAEYIFYHPLQGLLKKTPLIISQELDNSIKSIIEVKPSFDAQNMTRLFQINKKWMFDKYGIYVTKIVPDELFKQTFTPIRYLFTNSGHLVRKLDYLVLLLDEYLESLKLIK